MEKSNELDYIFNNFLRSHETNVHILSMHMKEFLNK
jgi:hypothetical protein